MPPTPVVRSPWPSAIVACVALVVALASFAILVFAPSEATDRAIGKIANAARVILDDPQGAIASALGVLSFCVSLYSGARALLHSTPAGMQLVPSVPPPPTAPRTGRKDGSSALGPMLLVTLAALFGVAGCALLLPGCGASALQQHAAGTTIAIVAVRGAEDAYLAHLQASEDTCHDEACVAQARAEHLPAEAALDSTRAAVLAWRDAVQVAADASQSDDVLGALETAAARVLARWGDLVAALRPLGVELPQLPPALSALVASVGGAS